MDERYRKARFLVAGLKAKHWESIRRDPNLVAAAFGKRIVNGKPTDDPALVFYVMKKVPSRFLPSSRLLPRKMYVGGDCVEVDVVETGPMYPHSFTARERPAPSGISIGPPQIGTTIAAGTLGCLVTDLSDKSLCILSNNHVLANENAASIGDPIVQPGSFDGGADPADEIAKLKRFVTINATGNTVDCAIAQVNKSDAALVIDQMKNNLMPTPNPNHPAIGLLFAGSCNRTLMNPISNVLSSLNIQFTAGAGSNIAADIGMNVEKVGRTTEYTTSTVTEIDVSVSINYNFGPASFDHQVATASMDMAGDSGSIVCAGGVGGSVDNCGCGTTSAITNALGEDVSAEQMMAQEVRDKFVRQTKIGRYALELFTLNEDRFLDRFRDTPIKDQDRDFARKMFHKYIGDARQAFIEGDRGDRTLTEQHFHDAHTSLRHAQKYMTPDEVEASEQLLRLAEERGKGKNAREVLAMLNDDKLLEQIQKVASTVKSVRKPGDPCN
jgi:hypothetical protein